MSKAKWPAGVPVFRDLGAPDAFAYGVDVESGWGLIRVRLFTDGEWGSRWRWPREIKPLNPDAAAMLAIAKESK